MNSGCKKVSLSKSDLEWFNAYEEGDTLIFRSQTGEKDTLVVITAGSYYSDCNRFELGDYQYNTAKFSMRYIKNGKLEMLENTIELSFSKGIENRNQSNSSKRFSVWDLDSSPKDMSIVETEEIQLSTTKNKHLVYVFLAGDSWYTRDSDSGSFDLEAFYWSKNYGLMRYDKKGGDIYELYKHLK
jgi:hypothetical protein